MKYMYCCGEQLINLETKDNQKDGIGEFWCDRCGATYRTKVYSIYSPEHDITFIMEDINMCCEINKEDEVYEEQVLISSEVVGCYKGKESDENTRKYYGSTTIEYFKSKENINDDLSENAKDKLENRINNSTRTNYEKTMCEIIDKLRRYGL